MEDSLQNGLTSYKKIRNVNQSFLDGYEVKKIAFFKTDNGNHKYVLQLNNDIPKSTVENYSLGFYAFVEKEHLSMNRKYLIWDTKPELMEIEGHKYIINEFRKPIKKMDSLIFFLYDRERYSGIIGDRIIIRNLAL